MLVNRTKTLVLNAHVWMTKLRKKIIVEQRTVRTRLCIPNVTQHRLVDDTDKKRTK
jgi:hypothetical protein